MKRKQFTESQIGSALKQQEGGIPVKDISRDLGREMCVLASKMFEIDIERKSQNQFLIFIGQKRHNDGEVLGMSPVDYRRKYKI
jgi:hypothetical protein